MKKSNLILTALLLCIAVLIGLIVRGNSDTASTNNVDENAVNAVTSGEVKSVSTASTEPFPDNASTRLDLNQLQQQLQQERQQRETLEKQVAQLSEQVKKLSVHLNLAMNVGGNEEQDNRQDKTASTGPRNVPQRISGWVDAKRLTEAGMTQEQASSITQLYENVEMDKLYLRDRAQREGWMASDRFRDEMDKLDERTRNLRNELGEQAYDALLYATGRPNRVYVDGTLGNSPAAQAGIKKGDAILRYADKPIYSWFDLREATAEGDASEMVAVEIQRGNKQMEVYVKRGPLGIRLDQQSVNPAP